MAGRQPAYTSYNDQDIAVTEKPVIFHKGENRRVLGVFVTEVTPGVKLAIHVPPSADAFKIGDNLGVDLQEYDFRGPVAYSCSAAPAGAKVSFSVVFEDN